MPYSPSLISVQLCFTPWLHFQVVLEEGKEKMPKTNEVPLLFLIYMHYAANNNSEKHFANLKYKLNKQEKRQTVKQ